ncbi:efflux RND transporter permease subunit [uncultured Abyssibacter sp.]|uniref:efflux RND transporter permease subunit n=1 Tax=uncultured Abyssibacter sp. TaxID=2320202 RepID=UPI0032B17BC0
MGFISTSVRRPIAVLMITLGFVLFGAVSCSNLEVTLLPDLNYPTLTVRTDYVGAAPAEVETLLSKPVEEALGIVKNLREVRSVSRAGQSDVVLEFAWGTEMDFAVLDVRERLDALELPDEASRPLVLRFDPSEDPIVRLALSLEDETTPTTEELKRLRRAAEDQVQRPLESVIGVAAVKISGGLEDEIQILLDIDKVAQLQMTPAQIAERLDAENVNLSGGRVEDGSAAYLVRTLNQFRSLEDIRRTILTTIDGRPIYVEDVATVVAGHKEREAIIRVGGREAVEVAIYKEGDANTVAAAKAVLARVDRLNEVLPEGLTLTGLYDQSVFIQSAINGVTQAGLYGALLAVLVLYLFLREARPTLIIALAIPISVIVTFMPMRFAGLSLNIMSLGGMALAIGLLVDNAIVVLENIARRREAGASLVDAAVAGAGEVSGAIVASTLTTVAVFFPMVFVQGIAGQLFADQALVVTFALLVSLAVSLTVIPTLAARGGQRHEIAPRESLAGQARWRRGVYGVLRSLEWLLTWLVRIPVTVIVVIARMLGVVLRPVVALWNRAYGALARGYARLLDAALKARALVLIVATLAFAGSLWLATQLGVELIPPMDQGEFSLEANLPPGTPLEGSDRFLRQVQSAFQDDPAVRTVYGVAGTGNRLDSNPELGGENVASISFAMADGTDEMALRQRIRERVEHTPGLEYRFETPTLFSTEKPLEVEIAGYDLAALERIAASLQSRLEDSERFVDVESTSEQGQPEVRVVFEQERAAALGLQVSDLAARVVTLVQGDVATRYRVSDREIDVVVRGKEANQTSYDDLKRLVINPESEHPIPLESVASVRLDRGPAEIRRTAQQRVVVLSMDLAYGDLGSAVEELDTHLADIHVPRGISTRIGGQSEEMEVSFRSLQLALGLAIFLVYLVMASQFESLIHPFVILFSVPLAAIGAFTALFITGTEINVVALIGLIVLAGIVVNNAIVLIDLINRLRADGQSVLDAIREAGQARLRPILMTTLTTALGLLPLALGGDDGAEVRAPLAITVIGGLMVSTLLTLVVIPVVYSLVTRDRPATGTTSSETPA